MTIEIIKRVRHAKAILKPGDFVEITEKEEERLVKLGYARSIKAVPSEVMVNPPADEIDAEYYKESFEDLKEAYTKATLIEAATEANVEFDPKAKLDDIIDAVIRQNKVDDLLTDEDE